MRAKVVDCVLPTLGKIRLRIYHACPAFHCGFAAGPAFSGRWWAESGLTGWVYLWDSDDLRHQATIQDAIGEAFPSPADLARRAQDERYEGPDA